MTPPLARAPGRAVVTAAAGRTESIWRWAADHPAVALALVVALHTLPTLGARELWFADEVRHGNILQSLREGGHWVVLYLNGVPYGDKPPGYFWLLAVIAAVFDSERPWIFFLAVALSTYALVLATHAMARWVHGAHPRAALHAALVPLGALYVAGAAHYTRPDLLFAALIAASHVALFRAWMRERAFGLALLGFGLGGVAVLTKGPLGLLLPLLASVAYLAWRRRLRRITRLDAVLGIAFGLLPPLAWLAAVRSVQGQGFVQSLFVHQVYERATASFMHARPVYYYLLVLPLVWLPWTLGLVGRPWTARARGDAAGDPGPTERDGEGRAYLWCVLATGLIVLSAISIKLEIYLLPLVPPLAVLTADTLARAPEKARRRIWLAVTLGLIAVAAAVAALPWFVQEPALTGIALASAVLLAAVAAGVFLLRRGGVEPALAALVLGLAGTVNATLAFGGPALDALLSPRAGAEVIREYAAQGYLPIAHATFPGVYSYYVGARVRETRRFETLATVMRRHPRVVIAMRQRDWDRWTARPDGLTIVHRQRLAGTETLVVVSSR